MLHSETLTALRVTGFLFFPGAPNRWERHLLGRQHDQIAAVNDLAGFLVSAGVRATHGGQPSEAAGDLIVRSVNEGNTISRLELTAHAKDTDGEHRPIAANRIERTWV